MPVTEKDILQWGIDKGIMERGTTAGQYRKTVEEVGELGEGLICKDPDLIKDAIGDIVVTLVLQAAMNGFTLQECIEQAYGVIMKRTGKMIDGVFVKDGE